MVSTAASQQEGPGFDTGLVQGLPVLQVLWFPPPSQHAHVVNPPVGAPERGTGSESVPAAVCRLIPSSD